MDISGQSEQNTHLRDKSMERSQENFYFDLVASERVGSYKYLGLF